MVLDLDKRGAAVTDSIPSVIEAFLKSEVANNEVKDGEIAALMILQQS